MGAADFVDGSGGFFLIEAGFLEEFACGGVAFEGAEDEVFDGEVVVFEGFAGVVCGVEGGAESGAELRLGGCALDVGFAVEGGGDGGFESGDIDACFLENGHGDAAFLLEECEEDVGAFELGVGGFRREALGGLEGFLEFLGDFIEGHGGDFVGGYGRAGMTATRRLLFAGLVTFLVDSLFKILEGKRGILLERFVGEWVVGLEIGGWGWRMGVGARMFV